TYPADQLDPQAKSEGQVNAFTFPAPGDVIFVDQLRDPPDPVKKPVLELNIVELRYYEDVAVWQRKAVVSPAATPGEKTVTAHVRVLVCNESRCLQPETVSTTAKLTVAGAAIPVDKQYQAEVDKALGRGVPAPAPAPPNLPIVEPVTAAPPANVPADHKAALTEVLSQLPRQKV